MKDKLKTKKFWASVIGVIVLILQLFGVRIDAPVVNELIEAACAVLILLGLIDSPKPSDEGKGEEEGENKETEGENEGEEEKENENQDSENNNTNI